MKKITLLLFTLFLSFSAYSQFPNPGIEGFESTTGPEALPSTTWNLGTGVPGNQWAVFSNGVGSGRWTINSGIAAPPLVCQGTNAAYMNRVQAGGPGLTTENYLATPLVTVPANGQLRFLTRSFTSGNQGTFYDVKLSTTSQTNPAAYTTTLATYTEDQLTLDPDGVQNAFNICTLKIINFPANLIGTQVYVAFIRRNTQLGAAVDGDRWLLDAVQLNERCLDPVTPTTSGVFFNSANLTWTNPSGATSWEVEVLPAATAVTGFGVIYNGPLPYLATTTSYGSPLIQTPLAPNTPYKYRVRAICAGNIASDWTTVHNFTTTTAPPVCGGNFVDAGGPNANYPNNSTAANGTTVICPVNPGDQVTVTFTAFNTQLNTDILSIYDGNSSGATLLGSFSGTTLPPTFTSSAANGCLTFVFISNGVTNSTGWIANVTCAPPPPCPRPTALNVIAITPTTINLGWTNVGPATTWEYIALPCGSPAPTAATVGLPAPTNPFLITGLTSGTCYDIYLRGDCSSTANGISTWSNPLVVTTPIAPPICGGNFVDTGGITANYSDNEDTIVTICPIIPTDQVTVTFVSFNTEANWDGLYVFDGNTIGAPQLASANPAGNVPGGVPGSYWGVLTGANLPGPFTASSANGCLTFRFRSDGVFNNPGWLANITCGPPPTCPKPTAVFVTAITQNSATINWTEIGSASQWQVLVLPSNAPTPDATTPGWVTANTNPFIYTPLASGTQYKVYVRSFCSASDISLWSTPVIFATLITNDECINAVNVPVNPDVNCGQFVGGTLIGATASTQPNTCFGTADDDVWFSFVATSTSHSINLINVAGSTADLFHVLYSGSCTGLTQIYCSDPNQSNANGLTIGQTYYIRIYSWTATPNQTSTFNVCVGTIPPPITTSTTLYNTTQLVEDVLFNSTCATITNITSSTGTNFGSVNGIGYFNQSGSSFPFNEGIILMTGDVTRAPGPNTEGLGDGAATWPGDAQLFNYIQGLGIDPLLNSYNNATRLEFDFIPLINNISFDFIFASEEYGVFQCDFSDAFAFFLTNNSTGVTTNLAVLPSSTIPISVITIRNQLYNAGCASANPQYFANFYGAGGLDPLGAPIDFNGETVALTASSAVIPGTQYHIKLVIADRNDSAFDSAVFLKGGSFNIGTVELGDNLLEATNTALCDSATYTIISGLDPALYTFSWTFNGNPIPNESGPNLTVSQEGIYGINATYINTTCAATDTITIEFYDPVASGTPNNMAFCDSSGFYQFTLSQNNPSALGALSAAAYTVSYYATNADAVAEINALPNLYTNTTQFLQTIFVRVEDNVSGCYSVKPFDLIVQDLTPIFTITPNFSLCNGTNGTITVTATNYNSANATYTWTLDGNPLPDTTDQITVNQNGVYVVTVNNQGCTNTGQTTVTVIPIPVPDNPSPVTACNSYTLPQLTSGSYYTQTGGPNGTGVLIPANTVITSTQTIFVYAESGTTPNCTAETSFQITINPLVTPTFTAIGPICVNTNAPLLPNTSNTGGITGTWNPSTIDTTTVGTSVYTFTPDAGQCASAVLLNVTINASSTIPSFNPIAPICLNGIAPILPTNSNDLTPISGSWNPSTINTTVAGTTTYTFTPTVGQCAVATQLSVTVLAPSQASFTQIGPLCQGSTAPILPNSFGNNITGSWSPTTVNTTVPGTTTYTFTPDSGQCAIGTTMSITIHPTPVLAPVNSVTVCDSYILPILSIGNYFSSPNGVGPITNLTLTASQTVYVYAQSGTTPNCTDQDSFQVTITPSPQFTIEGGCDGSAYVLEVANANFNTDTATYNWSGPETIQNNGSSSIQVATPGVYTCIVTVANSANGCSTTVTFNATDISCQFPQGISPNGDGLNDTLDLRGFNVSKLSIFNRYGKTVYSKGDYGNEWGGQSDSGNELADGTYYYVMERKDGGDTKTGWVFINREVR